MVATYRRGFIRNEVYENSNLRNDCIVFVTGFQADVKTDLEKKQVNLGLGYMRMNHFVARPVMFSPLFFGVSPDYMRDEEEEYPRREHANESSLWRDFSFLASCCLGGL